MNKTELLWKLREFLNNPYRDIISFVISNKPEEHSKYGLLMSIRAFLKVNDGKPLHLSRDLAEHMAEKLMERDWDCVSWSVMKNKHIKGNYGVPSYCLEILEKPLIYNNEEYL